MSEVEFFFVDVFASRPLTGNPLVVVADVDRLEVAQMQAMAREFNQSETTFVVRPTRAEAQWRLRSFTPAGVEVGGAGHNALGAWLWLADAGRVGVGRFVQEIVEELLPVEVSRADDGTVRVTMDQSAPHFGRAVSDPGAVASALGIDPASLDPSLPPLVVSTGVAHLLVGVRSTAVVDAASPDPRALLAVLQDAGGEGCYVFATDTAALDEPADAYARFFNPTVRIAEDPATGTAAGPLAAALVHAGGRLSRSRDRTSSFLDQQVSMSGIDVVIEQGRVLGRPSRLVVHVAADVVRLTGSGLVVGRGRLTVSDTS